MSQALREVALGMLGSAHKDRSEAEWRLWQARDETVRLRLLFLEAQQREAIAQRDLDRAQEFLSMLWGDLKPSLVAEKPVQSDEAVATLPSDTERQP